MDPNLKSPAESKAPKSNANTTVSPWETFITGKKGSAEKLLGVISKGAITLPDDSARQHFVDALLAKPDRMQRFIALLQAAATAGETLRKIIADFADATILRLQLIPTSASFDEGTFCSAVSSWIASVPRPLSPADLNHLLILLHFGALRRVLDPDAAFDLVARAVAKPSNRSQKTRTESKPMAPLDVLLAAPPSRLILSSLIAHATAVKAQAAESNRRIAHQAAEIATLQDASANLKSRITELEAEIAALKQENVAANQTIRDLEHQLVDVRDGYQHKIDALRSRIRGVLRGQLTRWIETALEAARSEPPFTLAIQQRLEDALKLVETEVQWLQPSA